MASDHVHASEGIACDISLSEVEVIVRHELSLIANLDRALTSRDIFSRSFLLEKKSFC